MTRLSEERGDARRSFRSLSNRKLFHASAVSVLSLAINKYLSHVFKGESSLEKTPTVLLSPSGLFQSRRFQAAFAASFFLRICLCTQGEELFPPLAPR